MSKSGNLADQAGGFLKMASGWLAVRLAIFVALVQIVLHAPGWAQWILWLATFAAGVWTFLAVIRDSVRVADFLAPTWRSLWRRRGPRAKAPRGTLAVSILASIVVAVTALTFAWPSWKFMATSSLREDEIIDIEHYISHGIPTIVGSYNAARNHVFYNILSSLVPGTDSTIPLRGRLISLLSVAAALLALVVYAGSRGWLLPGVALAGLVSMNHETMKVVLEGRGYGLIFLFSILGCIAFAEWHRTKRQFWLNVLAVTCTLGAYTLPFYIVFGGSLLLLVFFQRPSRETLLAGLLSGLAILLLYFPILDRLLRTFAGYDDEYGDTFVNSFASMDGVFNALQFFLPVDLVRVGALLFVLLVLCAGLFALHGRFAAAFDRLTVGGVVIAVAAVLAFFLFCRTVPVRVSAFLAAPCAFAGIVMAGSLLNARFLLAYRPFALLSFALLALASLWKSQPAEPFLPRQDWRSLGQIIERAFPSDIRIWEAGNYSRLLEWNLASRRRPEKGSLDSAALGQGHLVAVEGVFKMSDEGKRLHWADLPEGVRYITVPLLLNYQRVFFLPPPSVGIASISANGRAVVLSVPGRQPPDPTILNRSEGHGDVLARETSPPVGSSIAQPAEITLPAMLTVTLDKETSTGFCNLLFTQGLGDKIVTADLQKADQSWQSAGRVFTLGELASIRIDQARTTAIQIRIERRTGAASATDTRPVFGLLDAWIRQ